MKKTLMITIVIIISLCICGCFNNPSTVLAYSLNHPWECEGNSVTVTGVTIADRYTSPDGTEHIPDADGVLMIVSCRVSMSPTWNISQKTSIENAGTNIPMLCGPISEGHADGEETVSLLFSIPGNAYSGKIQDYVLNVEISSGANVRMQLFHFVDGTN